jgi:hypothetical protein
MRIWKSCEKRKLKKVGNNGNEMGFCRSIWGGCYIISLEKNHESKFDGKLKKREQNGIGRNCFNLGLIEIIQYLNE